MKFKGYLTSVLSNEVIMFRWKKYRLGSVSLNFLDFHFCTNSRLLNFRQISAYICHCAHFRDGQTVSMATVNHIFMESIQTDVWGKK